MQVKKAIYGDLIDRCAAGYFPAVQTSEPLRAEWRDPGNMCAAPNPGLDPSGEEKLCVLRWGETSFLVGLAPFLSQVGANENQPDLF